MIYTIPKRSTLVLRPPMIWGTGLEQGLKASNTPTGTLYKNPHTHDTYLRNPYRDPSIDEPFEGLGSRGFASLTVITCGVNLLMSPPLTPASLPHAGADRSRT